MVKDPKDTSEVPGSHSTGKEVTTTTQPPADPNAPQPTAKTQEEMAAGQAALTDAAASRPPPPDPVNADPALAAETAEAMNRAGYARAHAEPEDWVEPGQPRPGDVPSRGIPAGGLLPGEVPPQGTPDHRTVDPITQSSPKGTDPAAAREKYYRDEYDEAADREKLKELAKESAKNREQNREQKSKK